MIGPELRSTCILVTSFTNFLLNVNAAIYNEIMHINRSLIKQEYVNVVLRNLTAL